MPLIGDEKIITAVGESYIASTLEKFLCVVTFGIYFVFVLRKRMMKSDAYILTTKRLVHVTLRQRHGKFPVSMGNVNIDLTSYFPGKNISGGYIRSLGMRIITALQMDAGSISISLPQSPEALQFAHHMQKTTSRHLPLTKSAQELKDLLPALIAPYMETKVGARRTQSVLATIGSEQLPLFPNEVIVHKIEGHEKFAPCCVTAMKANENTIQCCNSCLKLNCCCSALGQIFLGLWESIGIIKNCGLVSSWNKWQDIDHSSHLCTFPEENNYHFTSFLACCVKCLTIFTRPLTKTSDVFLTTNTVFYTSITRPSRWVSAGSQQRQSYFICWVPVRKLSGYQASISATGAHAVHPCCCGMCCTLMDCAGRGKYKINLFTNSGYSYAVSGSEPAKNWLADEEYVKAVTMIGVFHSQTAVPSVQFPDSLSAV